MLTRPPPRVAHWLASIAGGLFYGAYSQLIANVSGTSPIILIGGASVALIMFGLARPLRATGRLWRIGLFLPLLVAADPVLLTGWITAGLKGATGSTHDSPLIWSVIMAITLWPTTRILSTAVAPNYGRSGPVLGAIGILMSGAVGLPTGLACAAVLLLIADTTSSHERGWSPPSGHTQPTPLVAVLLGGMWLSSGWIVIRAVFDPTISGAAALVVGLLVGRSLRPAIPPLLWAGAAGIALWAGVHLIETGAPQLAALGLNGALGWDGRVWILMPLATVGLLVGPLVSVGSTRQIWRPIALAAGLWLGPTTATHEAMPWIAVGVLTLTSLFSVRTGSRAVAFALIIGVLTAYGWVPEPNMKHSRMSIWSSASSSRSLATWTSGPTDYLSKQHGQTEAGAFITWTQQGPEPGVGVTLDGTTATSTSRAAKAEELAGHLSVLLSPKREPQLFLGDWVGNALRGAAAHPPGLTHVSAPSVHALRSIASLDKVREGLWLQPIHPLYGEHPASLTHRTLPVQSIMEINHTPWTTGASWGLSASHVQAIKSRLVDGGVYVLCVHMRWWPDGSIPQISKLLTAEFSSVQAWLPPDGVDSIIFVASDTAPEFGQLKSRFSGADSALEALDIENAESLAGSAVLGTSALRELASQATARPSPHQLSSTLFSRPILHLGEAPALIESQPDPWNGTAPTDVAAVRAARATMLDMLAQATKGKLEGAFEAAQSLATVHGIAGKSALEAIIEPHLKDGRKALNRAVTAGPADKAWDDAVRFATTARMLAPKSHTPFTLLGDIALGRGNLPKALEHFKQALQIQPNHVPALEGLARCARLSNEPKKVEQALRDATRHAPRDWRTWHNLAVFQLELNQNEQAMTTIETALGLAPESELAPLVILTKTLLSLEQPGAALLRSNQLTRMEPKNGLTWFLRGRAHFDLNRFDEAEEDFRRAVLNDANLIEARSGIGLVRAIAGDNDSAVRIFRDVLKRDPDNAAARENLRRLGSISEPAQ